MTALNVWCNKSEYFYDGENQSKHGVVTALIPAVPTANWRLLEGVMDLRNREGGMPQSGIRNRRLMEIQINLQGLPFSLASKFPPGTNWKLYKLGTWRPGHTQHIKCYGRFNFIRCLLFMVRPPSVN